MIQVKELRIGNWVKMPFLGDVNLSVFGLAVKDDMSLFIQSKSSSGSTFFENPDKYAPITITEEWLLNFGFKKIPDGCYMFAEKDDIRFHISYITDCVIYFYCCGRTRTLKYVHEVQNLYFILTGEELTLSVT